MAQEILEIEALAKYTFKAIYQNELNVYAGEKIWILDDQDEYWWLVRNRKGMIGILPASYVL